VRYRNLLALLLLIAWLYGSILAHLFLTWVGPHSDPNFAHGIFVPLFSLFVLWQDRERLKAIAPAPSWAGLPLVVLSMFVLVLGDLGADVFLPRVSLLILLAGLIILFRGWKFFRSVLFPWAFLILMIPIPALIINRVTFPLQLFAARLSAALLGLVWVVHREGNIISLASGNLDVAEACSGLRSLLTLVTLAIIYGYLMETRRWVRVVLVGLAVPIAVVANSFRVFAVGLFKQFGYGDLAEGVPHALMGLLVFAVALTLLFAVHRVISLIWRSGPAASRSVAYLEEQSAGGTLVKAGSFRFGIVAVPMLATAIGLQAYSGWEVVKHVGSLPSQVGDWTGTDIPISQAELDILGPGEYLMRDYVSASQLQPMINLYIPFFPSQRAGDTIHSPDHCLLGAGWFPISREVIQLTRPNGSSMPVKRYVVSKSGERQLVLYWFQAHGRVLASEWQAKYYLISDSIHINRSDGGMVRLMTPMLDGESPDAAQARMMRLGSQFLPLIDSYIPR
jgi:exosortase D (VPLPA-CTERM-specific)